MKNFTITAKQLFHRVKKPFVKYLLELIIVAFGVFLGILVSEQKEKNKIEENIQKSKLSIIGELESNKSLIKNTITYHQMVKKSFDSLRQNLTEEIVFASYFTSPHFRLEHIPGWKGIGIIETEDIAFESSKINGIFQNMDIDDVKHISSIYRRLHKQAEFGNMLTQKFLGLDSDAKILDIIGIFELLTNDYLNNEKHLVAELENTVLLLKE